jgi:hypothetical protein
MKLLATTAFVGILLSNVTASAAENLKDAFTEGTLKGEIRTYYFTRDFDNNTTDREDMAIGTLLSYRTAPLYGITAGVSTATSSSISSDDDKAVYGLLAADASGDHDNYARLQEYFVQGNWFNTTLKLGAQQVSSPFLNGHDIRMTPKTYRGLTLENRSVENLVLKAFYLTDYMGWSDEDFKSMSSVTGEGDADEPLLAGSITYRLPVDIASVDAEAWHYRLDDVFNSSYFKANMSKQFENVRIHFTPSFLKQDSLGDDLAGHFDTHQYGFNTGVKFSGFDITAFYAKTGEDAIFAPWGDGKVLIQQINASGRADEDAYALKLGYDFANVGMNGLSAYVFQGLYDAPNSGANSASDISETNFSVQYKFAGNLDGLSARVRYAMVDYDDDTAEDFNDFRIYLNYSFSFSGKG